MKTHLTLTLNEGPGEAGYSICDTCGSRTLLVYPTSYWNVDSEPYKSGEPDVEDPADVEIDAEVSGHFCPTCRRLTSLSVNAD
jgi:hypothetical protein